MAGYAQGEQVAAGIWNVPDTGKHTVKITGVRWPHIHGLRVTSAWLVPILKDPGDGDWMEVGDGGSWPPRGDPTTDREWAMRVPLIGAVIKPGKDPGQGPQIVIEVARTGASKGMTDGPLVSYTSNGHSFTANDEGDKLEIAAKC
jgi:hypothetical protein